MNLKQKYDFFLLDKIDKDICSKFMYVQILGEAFISNIHFTVFSDTSWFSLTNISSYYILIDNLKENILIKLKTTPHAEKYIIFPKNNLKDKIPKRAYKALAKNGLYATFENAFNKNNKPFLLSRLVTCQYQNTLGLEVHHIYKDLNQNNINSLLPVEKDIHKSIHALPIEEGIKESNRLLDIQKKEIFNPRKNMNFYTFLYYFILFIKKLNNLPIFAK